MRILAVDPGSSAVGIAFFEDDRLLAVAGSRPLRKSLTWLERCEQICRDVWDLYYEHGSKYGWPREEEDVRVNPKGWSLPIPIIAIEETVAFRATLNVSFVLARGYLIRYLSAELIPGAELLEVPLSSIRHELGIKGNATRKVRQQAARARFPMATTEDEADAAAVGMTAARIIAERREQSAG